jgi:hypothetical protein
MRRAIPLLPQYVYMARCLVTYRMTTLHYFTPLYFTTVLHVKFNGHCWNEISKQICPGEGWEFFSSPPCPERLWSPPDLLPNGDLGLFPSGESGLGVKLTIHLHLAPRSRMRGDILLLPQHVFMVWCLVKHRDNFTFTLTLRPVTFMQMTFKNDQNWLQLHQTWNSSLWSHPHCSREDLAPHSYLYVTPQTNHSKAVISAAPSCFQELRWSGVWCARF